MNALRISAISLLFVMTGCSWQKIPPSPSYVTNDTIPLKVAITGKSDEAQMIDGLATELKGMKLFDSITYPYRDGDPVDLVLDLQPTFVADTSGNFGRGFLIGATFFTLSPFMGPKVEYDALVPATIKKPSGKTIAEIKAEDHMNVEFGLGANTNDVRVKSRQVIIQRLADDLAKKIRGIRSSLISASKS